MRNVLYDSYTIVRFNYPFYQLKLWPSSGYSVLLGLVPD